MSAWHSERLGHGPRCVLMLHGWGQSRADLRPLADLLSESFDVHLLDLPGFGDSAKPASDWGTSEYAEYVYRYIEDQELESVIIVGHSFGARIAVRIAARWTARVAGLVLIAAAGLPRRRTVRQRNRLALVGALRIAVRLLSRIVGRRPQEWFVERFASRDYREAGQLRGILVKTVNEDLSEVAREVQCQTLLLWGEADSETPLEMAHRLARLIRLARLVAMPHKAHFPHHGTGAHLCAYYILGFLNSRQGSGVSAT